MNEANIIDHEALMRFCNSLVFEACEAAQTLPLKTVCDVLVGVGTMVATRISSREEASDWLRRVADQFEKGGSAPRFE